MCPPPRRSLSYRKLKLERLQQQEAKRGEKVLRLHELVW